MTHKNRINADALRSHLFGALEGVNQDFDNPDFDRELFLLEIEKANAIGNISGQIINLQKLELQHHALRLKAERHSESQIGLTKMIESSNFFENEE